MNLTNLYHDSTTPNQLKAVKRAKADEMRIHLNAMKLVTQKYAPSLKLLTTLREQELIIGNNAKQERYSAEQLDQVSAVLSRNRKKAQRVTTNILKKSIDKV